MTDFWRRWILTAVGLAGLTALAGAAAARLSVDQVGQVFSVTSASLTKGGTITFNNHDDVIHNISVYAPSGDGVDLGLQKPGVSLSYKFDKQGRFTVRCSIHPSMKMAVDVK